MFPDITLVCEPKRGAFYLKPHSERGDNFLRREFEFAGDLTLGELIAIATRGEKAGLVVAEAHEKI